jgi:hypothetical protein
MVPCEREFVDISLGFVLRYEEVQGSVPVGDPLEFRTTKGLLLPGSVSLFRVYVVNDTDNEKGSDTVVVTRPGD